MNVWVNHNPLLSRPILNPTLRVMSFGGGIQSWALARAAQHGLIGPMPDFGVMGDTADEPEAVWRYFDENASSLPFPIYRVSKGDINEHIARSKAEPDGKQIATLPYYLADGGQMMRTCTDTFKIAAVTQRIREHLGLKKGERVPKDVLVEVWVGFSMDEKKRAGGYPGERWQEIRYPLLEADLTRGGCEKLLTRLGYRIPPRSRCKKCPFRSDESWMQLTPEEFEDACRTDESLREGAAPPRGYASLPFLHRKRIPLRQVDFTPPSFGLPLEDNEEEDCFGGCGT